MNHTITLEKYSGQSSRYTCPQCGVKHTFTRYINTQTGEHLAEHVGRCNREYKCGYHYKPKQYYEENPNTYSPIDIRHVDPETYSGETSPYGSTHAGQTSHKLEVTGPMKQKAISYLPESAMQETFTQYGCNHLVHFLRHTLGHKQAMELVRLYHVGTSNYWDCSTVFWQVDAKQRIRTGKVMLYEPTTGKRIKTPQNYITWMHSILKYREYNLRQCFFGEHLLTRRNMKVALVESEKTAILATAHLPQYT